MRHRAGELSHAGRCATMKESYLVVSGPYHDPPCLAAHQTGHFCAGPRLLIHLQRHTPMQQKGTISRRSVLRGAALAFTGARAGLAERKATAFALIGDRYHNSDYIRTALGKTLGKDLGVAVDFCDEVKMLRDEHL